MGETLGRYRILERAAAGGMGVVYRARDDRLGRDVALKLLPPEWATQPERLGRFEREARSASALNHPNIVTIYEIGQEGATTFIAMEWIEGRTLSDRLASGPLPPEEVLSIAAQIAAGLAKAHQAGIVHRDLKPGNIMVTGDGIAKILDFGLAKLVEPAGDSGGGHPEVGAAGASAVGDPPSTDATRDIAPTRLDVLIGTPAYMSPEQVAGRPVDFRSDQFSLGLVLYEMATGKRAFDRGTDLQTLAALLSEQCASIRSLNSKVPQELDAVVERCLQKDPGARYASTNALAQDLEQMRMRHLSRRGRPGGRAPAFPRSSRSRAVALGGVLLVVLFAVLALVWWGREMPSPSSRAAPADIKRPTLAVLPFRALAGKSEDRELGLGIADAIIAGLGGSPDLIVRPTRVVLGYEDKSSDPIDVGKTLRVGAVLDGTLQRSGGQLRIQVQLWQVPDGTSLWAQKYDVAAGDVFSVQDQIGSQVAQALRVRLTATGRGRLATPYSTDPNVYALMLRARGLELRQGRESLPAAISLYEEALQKEPDNAVVHAWLASACRMYSFLYDPNSPAWLEKAENHSRRALELDPNLAEAYAAEASVLWTPQRHFQHDRSMDLYRKALDLNPNLATERGFYAVVLSHVGLLDRAAAEAQRALETDPADVRTLADVAENYVMSGDAERGEEAARIALGVDPDYLLSKMALMEALVARRKVDEAQALLARNYLGEARYLSLSFGGLLAAERGEFARAESLGREAEKEGEGLGPYHHVTYALAEIYAMSGKKDEAVRWLRRTAEEGMPCYPMFRDDPQLKNLRGYPAYEKLLEEMRGDWQRRRGES